MATIYKVDCQNRKPLFEGVQGENEARSIQFDITPWAEELGSGAVTATAKRPQDSQPYPVTVTKDGNIVTWKPTSTDTAYEGVGSFQLEYTVGGVIAKTCIWSTQIAPSLDPAGDPPDPYDNWLADMREIEASAIQAKQDAEQAVEDAQDEVKNAEAWAVGQRGGVDVPSTDPAYENNAKYWAEQSQANQYSAFIVKSASGEIASFSDGADDVPMKSLKVAIVPKQSGSGDPSPDNVRPITGWTDADVNVARIHASANSFNDTSNGAEVNKYLDSNGNLVNQMGYSVTEYIPVEEGDDCSISASGVVAPSMCFYDENKTFLIGKKYNNRSNPTETAPANAKFARFSYGPSWGSLVTVHTTTTPVPLGQTVYSGEVDPISGELVIDKAGVDLGTLAWTLDASYSRFYTTSIASLIKAPANNWTPITGAICSNYSVTDNNSTAQHAHNNQFGVAANGRLDIRDEAYTTAEAFKTAMNGVMFVYPLKTPTTVQLTPAQVATLLGANNVWSDAGAVEVEYRADPTLAYAELQALILENI